MKPELEILALDKSGKSIKHFEVEQPVFEPYWHYHTELELTLITKGSGTRFVGDSILPYREGDLVLVGSNLPHHWVSAAESPLHGAVVIQFPVTLFSTIRECASLQDFFRESEKGLYFPGPGAELIAALQTYGQLTPLGQISRLMTILETLQGNPNRKQLAQFGYLIPRYLDRHQGKVSETLKYILERLDQPLTVEELASYTHMVPQSFCRWFKKAAGMSFITFLNRARIERACQDLLYTDKPVTRVAFDNGFESISHFNRTFRKAKGITPSRYRLNR